MLTSERMAARLAHVEEHIAHENQHDLDGIMATFGTMTLPRRTFLHLAAGAAALPALSRAALPASAHLAIEPHLIALGDRR
jgi:hypothetical protein